MTKRGMLLLWAAVCSAILVFFSPAQASLLFQAQLTGAAERLVPVATPATGFVTVLLNDAETGVTINLTFSGLLAPQSAAHIHCCATADGVAAVRIAPPTLPLGNLVDFFVLIPDNLPGAPPLTRAGFVQGLKDELAYFNVHSSQFPGGEIRGQLRAVPAPTTLLLLGAGLAAVAAAIRRRRFS